MGSSHRGTWYITKTRFLHYRNEIVPTFPKRATWQSSMFPVSKFLTLIYPNLLGTKKLCCCCCCCIFVFLELPRWQSFCLNWHSVGLPNVLALLKSEDLDVQIHAVKVVANLAAEGLGIFPLHLCIYSTLPWSPWVHLYGKLIWT